MIPRIPFAALLLALIAGLMACASKDEPRSAQDAMAASKSSRQQEAVVVYPAGCYDEFGRPARPHSANSSVSGDPACYGRPAPVQQRRRSVAPASDPMSGVGLPRTMPLPVPGGIGGLGR